MKYYLMIITTFLSLTAFCQETILSIKFNSLVLRIEGELKKYNSAEINITELSQGSLRQILFSTQTLASLFSAKYEALETVRIETKRLEDEIGAYRKSIEQLEYAKSHQASLTQITNLEKRKAALEKELIGLIANENWISQSPHKVDHLKNILKEIKWHDDQKEKSDTYRMMEQELTRIDETPWNMTVLEGQGIHDLRKEMRWYKLQTDALTDFIGIQSETCNQGAIVPSNKKSGGKCLISSCLHSKMSEIYNVFGSIKDEGEGHDGLGEGIDQNLLKPAQDLYREIKKDNLFKNLAQEFNQCESEK